MYIARRTIGSQSFYSIRKSQRENGVYISRELMDLGRDPRVFIRYPLGRSFYVDGVVEDTLKALGETVDYDTLEQIFWPFVREEVRRKYQGAFFRKETQGVRRDVSGVHLFDKRRLAYLRTGSMNQRHIRKVPDSMFATLTEKSRDELEQRFMDDESRLNAREIKGYVFVIFDLHRHFDSLIAREMPQALNQDTVADHLVDDLCALNRDSAFWAGMGMDPSLHPYLIRYLIMFFDTEYQKPRILEDLEFARMNSRRYYRQTGRGATRPGDAIYDEAADVFGVSKADLKTMDRRRIQRLYRKKARELHPDRGGTHETFIRLSRIYDELLSVIRP